MLRRGEGVYARLLRPLLFRLDAESAHRLTLGVLARLPALDLADPPELHTTLLGLTFSNPVGLAAGMDKDGRALGAWQTLGFGFAELGTITPRPQPGNPRPRLWRVIAKQALVNRLGFPSLGMEAAGAALERARRRGLNIRLGVNLGPNRDTPPDRVAGDYAALMARLGADADFVVLNVSSPNTPGLRDWQAPERIRLLVEALGASVAEAARRPPLFIKLAPDLDGSSLKEICAAALELKVGGIVAANTAVARDLASDEKLPEGGLSGRPLMPRTLALVRDIYGHTGGKLAIIGVGGIFSAADAFEYLCAGATLVEIYTALVYRGPAVVRRIRRGLLELVRNEGRRSVAEIVGSRA